jgi:hypothetical protein
MLCVVLRMKRYVGVRFVNKVSYREWEKLWCTQMGVYEVVFVDEERKCKVWANAALIVGADTASKLLEGGRSLESERQVAMDPLRTAWPQWPGQLF